jgi:hypothetical protein
MTKKLLLLIVIVSAIINLNAQDLKTRDVPAVVKSARVIPKTGSENLCVILCLLCVLCGEKIKHRDH